MEVTWLDVINLIGSLSSLILAVLAIWLSVRFFLSSKDAETHSSNTLTKIDQQVATMRQITSRMLEKFVDHSVAPRVIDNAVAEIISSRGFQGIQPPATAGLSETASSDDAQNAVTGYIATVYWSALANTFLQARVPTNPTELDSPEFEGLRQLLASSKNDYFVGKTWLKENGGDLIASSTAKSYYDQFISVEDQSDALIKDALDVYVSRNNDPNPGSSNAT